MVAVKVPEVNEMMQRAQDKVDAIQRVQIRTGGICPIDEVILAQNVPTYNPEWQHSNEGRAKQYLGGYAMEQQRGKAEAEGKELPYKQCKKLQTKDTAIPSTSGVMEH